MGSRTIRRLGERVDDVLGRPGLGVPAAEVDDRLTVQGRRSGDAGKERPEVLLRQPL